jgi:hypothetical protein
MIRRCLLFCVLDFFAAAGRPLQRSADPHLTGGGTVFVDSEIVASGVVSA